MTLYVFNSNHLIFVICLNIKFVCIRLFVRVVVDIIFCCRWTVTGGPEDLELLLGVLQLVMETPPPQQSPQMQLILLLTLA